MTATARRNSETPSTADDRRYAIRINVQIEADLVDQGRRHFSVVLTNLSITGCRFECSQPLRVPGSITLMIEGIEPIPATLVWMENGLIGAHFDEALRPTICNRIIRTLRDRADRK
ncbi:PilZ domain-containing protein [Blastomonas sp.]|uniref:PilZ domain-containing protein n=1 Tax=Blastomonas sp. TaxID=1909299 RepID=UPI003594262A